MAQSEALLYPFSMITIILGSVLCDNMVVIGLEEDIIPKLESIEVDIITTTDYPTDTTKIEDIEDIQTTEPTPTESPKSLESGDERL